MWPRAVSFQGTDEVAAVDLVLVLPQVKEE